MSSTGNYLAAYDDACNNGQQQEQQQHQQGQPMPTHNNHPVKQYAHSPQFATVELRMKEDEVIKTTVVNGKAHAVLEHRKTARRQKWRIHLNNLWSFWYGLFGTVLQAYIAVKCIKRILGYSLLPWPLFHALPVIELNVSLGLTAAAVLLIPFFLFSAACKVGNLANDGFKLGRNLNACNKDPPVTPDGSSGGCSVFRHGGPTAAFLHLVIAFCLLLPKLLMEAKLIEADLLPKESVWHTDLDFLVHHRDRLVVLRFLSPPTPLTAPTINDTASLLVPMLPLHQRPSALPVFNSILTTQEPIQQHGNLVDNGRFSGSNGSEMVAGVGSVDMVGGGGFTHTMVRTLREYIGHEKHDEMGHKIETGWGSSVSAEFFNFAMALMVYAVRYPSMFWATNKWLGILFSFQLFLNGIQTLLAFAGMSILYKVQVIGPWKTLPLLKHQPGGFSPNGGMSPFLLNPQVTLALYLLSILLVLSSSLVLYLYGHTRFNSFLNRQRQRVAIELKDTHNSTWTTFTHCAALCVLLSVCLCTGPLLYDYTVVYKGSLDAVVLLCIIGGICHLFAWIVLWLFLTVKQKWIFKLRVTVAKASFSDAPSVKLVTDLDLQRKPHSDDPAVEPLVVVGHGQTYVVNDLSPKKAIMGVLRKQAAGRRYKMENSVNHQQGGSEAGETTEDEEQIYWLKPALVSGGPGSVDNSPDGSQRLCWFQSKPKLKVTFDDNNSTSNAVRSGSKSSNGGRRRMPGVDVDDGDYATLKEVAQTNNKHSPSLPEDNISEEGKLLACVHDEHVTYASTSQDLVPPTDYEDPSPLLTPEPFDDKEDHHKQPISVIVHNHAQPTNGSHTPRCLRRADSGMPHEELTPRSDSISTTESSSCSPPDPPGSNHSETSSGIHSNESGSTMGSGCEHVVGYGGTVVQSGIVSPPPAPPTRRATSVLELAQTAASNIISPTSTNMTPTIIGAQWKSASLQRNMQPPTEQQTLILTSNNQPPIITNTQQVAPVPSDAAAIMSSVTSIYGYSTGPNGAQPQYVNAAELAKHGGVPAVIMEDGTQVDSTVVIRRKLAPRPKLADPEPIAGGGAFGRQTNMRMTSFTENLLNSVQASSATLPHYPTTQPPVTLPYPHCNTMPLPQHHTSSSGGVDHHSIGGAGGGGSGPPTAAGSSCHVYVAAGRGTTAGQHTTIPTHHNGVRLFAGTQNPYIRRLQGQGGISGGGSTAVYQQLGKTLNANTEHIYTGVNRNSGEIYHYST